MNLELTEEQDMIIGMVRKFVREEILPLELDLDPDADELGRDDRERLIEKTKAMGLYGLDIPPEYGGPEIDLVTRTLMAVEMAQRRGILVCRVLCHRRGILHHWRNYLFHAASSGGGGCGRVEAASLRHSRRP